MGEQMAVFAAKRGIDELTHQLKPEALENYGGFGVAPEFDPLVDCEKAVLVLRWWSERT